MLKKTKHIVARILFVCAISFACSIIAMIFELIRNIFTGTLNDGFFYESLSLFIGSFIIAVLSWTIGLLILIGTGVPAYRAKRAAAKAG